MKEENVDFLVKFLDKSLTYRMKRNWQLNKNQ